MKSQHLKVFFVWFAHTPLSTSLMDGKISSSRLSANMIWEYNHIVDPEVSNPILHHQSKDMDNYQLYESLESLHCTSKTHLNQD